jgi:very-short-patch-repair endonuclease
MPDQTTLQRARALRVHQTDAEGRLWSELRGRRLGGWKWRRQAAIAPFIVDFYCPAASLVVELDGSQHLDQMEYDARRTRFLGQRGLRVLRFDSENIWGGGLDFVCRSILAACDEVGDRREAAHLTRPPAPRPADLSSLYGRLPDSHIVF